MGSLSACRWKGHLWGCWVHRRLGSRWFCSKAAAGKMNLYESFAQATQLGDLHTCLMMDMKACQEDDVRLLCHLTPSIYTEVRVSAGSLWGGGEGVAVQGSQEMTTSVCTHLSETLSFCSPDGLKIHCEAQADCRPKGDPPASFSQGLLHALEVPSTHPLTSVVTASCTWLSSSPCVIS